MKTYEAFDLKMLMGSMAPNIGSARQSRSSTSNVLINFLGNSWCVPIVAFVFLLFEVFGLEPTVMGFIECT